MKLNLGVVDIPYASSGGTTTGDVAEILESKYQVMGHFYEMNQDKIADAMANGLAGALESLLQGAPPPADPFEGGTQKIQTMFKNFIDSKALDGAVGGVPTAASLKGRSKRFKRNRGPVRPSFQDTALYEDSFRAWVTQNA